MTKSRFTKSECLVGAFVLIALTSVATPNIFSAFANARKAKTINNAKMIGIALIEFDTQYGGLPGKDTKDMLIDEGNKVAEGATANHYFSQLLIGKILDSEQVFHIDGLAQTKKADDVFGTPKTTLAQGENGFGYVLKTGDEGFSATDRASIPVVVAPLLKGGKLPTFQGRPFHGDGVALRLDCSVGTYKINKEGILLSKETEKNLFLTGEGSIWGKDTPDVKEPWLLEEKKKEAK